MIKSMTKEDYKALQQLDYDELERIIEESWNWHNSAGGIRVEKYIKDTFWMRDDNIGESCFIRHSKGVLLPDGINGARILTVNFPVKIQKYFYTRFDRGFGMWDVGGEWCSILSAGIHDLKMLNYVPRDELQIVVYKFHVNKKVTNPDNFTTVLITDILCSAGLLKGNSYQDVISIMCGRFNDKYQGTEIFMMPFSETLKHPTLLQSIMKTS